MKTKPFRVASGEVAIEGLRLTYIVFRQISLNPMEP